MFMSFKLETAQQNYSTSEREALEIMRALAEVRWLVKVHLPSGKPTFLVRIVRHCLLIRAI
jgi:hypothetical protein